MKRRTSFAFATCVLAAVLLAIPTGCTSELAVKDVFVGLPQQGEGWLWQTFEPPHGPPGSLDDTATVIATFTLITYGRDRTVKVALARYYPDHSGLESPLAQEWRTFRTDILDSTEVTYEFRNVDLTPLGETPFAFYFFVEGAVTCDLLARTSLDYGHGCLRLQRRHDREPAVIGNAYFSLHEESR